MNNTYQTIIGLLVRAAVLWFMGALTSHLSPNVYNAVNESITKIGGPEAMVTAITGTVAMVTLGIWLKLKSRLHLDIALGLPQGSTTSDIKRVEDDHSIAETLQNPKPIK